jgi:hypothetical protein
VIGKNGRASVARRLTSPAMSDTPFKTPSEN